MIWALAAACTVATVPAGLRWLRVAQREHYLAPATTRFARRWWAHGPINPWLLLLSSAGVLGALWSPWFGWAVVAAQAGPMGLSIRGRTSPLVWTGRLRRLAGVTVVVVLAIYVLGATADSAFVVAMALAALPLIVDLVLVLLGPVERALGNRWVRRAAARLSSSGADVVAITGSYGKTTTKGYVAHLLRSSKRVVASPASFNNRMGLARAINEHLLPGTEVFVAEMGTYRAGEIAELCGWIRPKVAAIVAIGPVHLERFRTEEKIVAAKAEILDRADVGVLAVDHPLLAELANERRDRLDLITVGPEMERVTVQDGSLIVDGRRVGSVPSDVIAINLCVAVGICLALGVGVGEIASRLRGLPRAEHRQTIQVSQAGVTIIDDTYNSNPAGAESALDTLAGVGPGGRKVVVTPGMVELGRRQAAENEALSRRIAEEFDDLVIVGGTNRRALLRGSAHGDASVTVVGSRDEAVNWVKQNLTSGDTVLYENDLPDHYP